MSGLNGVLDGIKASEKEKSFRMVLDFKNEEKHIVDWFQQFKFGQRQVAVKAVLAAYISGELVSKAAVVSVAEPTETTPQKGVDAVKKTHEPEPIFKSENDRPDWAIAIDSMLDNGREPSL